MVTVDSVDRIGGGCAAPPLLGRVRPLGQAAGPTRCGGAPSQGPGQPVLPADGHSPRWACDIKASILIFYRWGREMGTKVWLKFFFLKLARALLCHSSRAEKGKVVLYRKLRSYIMSLFFKFGRMTPFLILILWFEELNHSNRGDVSWFMSVFLKFDFFIPYLKLIISLWKIRWLWINLLHSIKPNKNVK